LFALAALRIEIVGVPAVEEAEEFVEAAVERVIPLRPTEVPFADCARRVAGGLQAIGYRRFRQRQAPLLVRLARRPGIELVAEALLYLPP